MSKYDFVFALTGNENAAFVATVLEAAVRGSLTADFFVALGKNRAFMNVNACAGGAVTGGYVGGAFAVGRARLEIAKELIKSFVTNKPQNCDISSVVHMIFNDSPSQTLRQDDTRLPIGLRLKHGDEHVRFKWTDIEFGPVVPSRPIELPERGRRY